MSLTEEYLFSSFMNALSYCLLHQEVFINRSTLPSTHYPPVLEIDCASAKDQTTRPFFTLEEWWEDRNLQWELTHKGQAALKEKMFFLFQYCFNRDPSNMCDSMTVYPLDALWAINHLFNKGARVHAMPNHLLVEANMLLDWNLLWAIDKQLLDSCIRWLLPREG